MNPSGISPTPRLVTLRKLVTVLIAAGITCTSSGCIVLAIGGAAGAGGIAYAKGNKKRTYGQSIDDVSQATLNALADLELNVTDHTHDQIKGRIDAYTATGDHVKIKLENLGRATELDLRVNTFGNNSISQMILDRIDQYLPEQSTGMAVARPLPEAPHDQMPPAPLPSQAIQPAGVSNPPRSTDSLKPAPPQ